MGDHLFAPLIMGELTLPNRVVMAPLTRNRSSGPERVPNELMCAYYVQRASAGLIISEATSVMPSGVGYPHTPGIWSSAQVQGWRAITDAVHGAGGRIVSQLWHVGRISDPSFHDGAPPVAPSAIAARGTVSLLRPPRPYPVPRALALREIAEIVDGFHAAAANAKLAGFDGVHVHGANGYLIDQFLQDSTNQRGDRYGGSIENRARLMLEIVDAVVSVWGRGRVGMHLSPLADAHDMGDSDLAATFGYVVRALSQRELAFLCVREASDTRRYGPDLRAAFRGAYIANEGFTPQAADAIVAAGGADAVAFGKAFIANPDLPDRIRRSAPLAPWNSETFYTQGPAGYTDYPSATAAP